MQDFKKLEVWRRSYALALAMYRATKAFPREEQYGLTSQSRRCAVSIPANIAEGCGRQTNADLNRFLHIAMGSAAELECLLMLASDLDYLDAEVHTELHDELQSVRRQLNRLIQTVNHNPGS